MKKLVVLMMVLMSIFCYSETFYVDPSKDDSGNGLTVGTAKGTLKAAIALVAAHADASSTIYLIAGTYDDSTQTWDTGSADHDFPAKNITFQSYTSPVTLDSDNTVTSGWFRAQSDRSAYTYTFNNINFDDGEDSGVLFGLNTNCGFNVVLNNCNIISAFSVFYAAAEQTTAGVVRNITMTNCTVTTSESTTAKQFYLVGFGDVSISNCTFTNNLTSTTGMIFDVSELRGLFELRNCRLYSYYPILISTYNDNHARAIIDGCTITAENGAVMNGIAVGNSVNETADTVYNVSITNCIITGFEYCIYNFGKGTYVENCYLSGDNPLCYWGNTYAKLINNTVIATAQASNRVMVMGRKLYTDWFNSNTFTATTVASSAKSIKGAVITESGSTTTVTISNNYLAGDVVVFAGCTNASNNGSHQITSANAGAFVYTDLSNDAETCPALSTSTQTINFASCTEDRTMIAVAGDATNQSDVPIYYGVIYDVESTTNTISVDDWIEMAYPTGHTIDAAAADTDTFTITEAASIAGVYAVGMTFTISGSSSGNNGVWTVESVTCDSPYTTALVTVVEDVTGTDGGGIGIITVPAPSYYYISVARWSHNNYIINNYFNGADAVTMFTYDYNPVSGNNYIDNNLYYYDAGTNFSNYSNATSADLTAMITLWKTWPNDTDLCYFNDNNSTALSEALYIGSNGYITNTTYSGYGRQDPSNTGGGGYRSRYKN